MDGKIYNTEIPASTTNVYTDSLLDHEAKTEAERRAAIGKITLEVEEIFLRENMSMGDLLEVFGLLTGRANDVFSKIKIKKIKEDYGKV